MDKKASVAIGIVTVSDRASSGVYEDVSGPAIEAFLQEVVTTPWGSIKRLGPEGIENGGDALIDLAHRERWGCVFTTGETGPAPRDLTPEATEAACTRMMPGFGELMRMESLKQVPTAILSRQTAGIRGATLIVNLPGRPSSIRFTLQAVFPAIPYCLDLIGAGRIETDPAKCKSFRPQQ